MSSKIDSIRLYMALVLLGASQEAVEETMKERESYLTAEEVAEYLKIDVETVRRLTREQTLTGVSVGGQWRYKRSAIDADLEHWTQHRRKYYARERQERREKQERRRARKGGGQQQ